MKFKYLGTAAAEGWPAVFCNCPHCLRAKAAGGKNIRSRSQALVNDDFLFDFPPDANMHKLLYALDLSAVKYLAITHSHLDHFATNDLFFRSTSYYAHSLTEEKLYMLGNQAVLDLYNAALTAHAHEPKNTNVEPILLDVYTPTQLDGYTLTAMRAYHAHGQVAHIYHLTDKKSSLLYLHDTGRLYDDLYDYMTKNGLKADLISYDCTYGPLKSGGGHMGLDSCAVEKQRLIDAGIANPGCLHVVNHFSHNSGAIYDELVPLASAAGFITSYDGLELTL